MSTKRYDDEFLRRLRNEISIDRLIRHLTWPNKQRNGRFTFVCPRCGETDSAVKRETNLGRCFHCGTNFNPIDFVIHAREYDFVQAVEFLAPLLPP
jgi:DNA primase